MQAPQMPSDLPPGLVVPPRPEPPAAGLFVRLYVTGWFLLSGLAVAYFALLIVYPESVSKISGLPWSGEPQKPQRTNTQLAIELEAVRRTLADVQRDLAHVKTNLVARLEELTPASRQEAPATTTTGPVSTMPPGTITTLPFAAPGFAQAPLPAAPPADQTEPSVVPAAPTHDTQPRTTDEARAKPKAPPPTAAVKTAERLETGSLPPKAPQISFGPATITRAPRPVGIMLESSTSLESLRVRWSLLQETHGTALKNLAPHYVTSADGQSYQLVAGPIVSVDEGKRLCALLRVKNVSCTLMSNFTGEPL